MMVYLTDLVGLAAGVVGTLIAVSKLFDGFTDIFFGSMIDKTHSKMGKAKPWMLYGYIGCAITLVCCFAVPVSWGTTAKYAWFFISYTLLNGVFYTANNIAYSALTSLITKNSKERVQMGSYRFIFAFSTSVLIQAITVGFVDKCGGDAAAWRTVAYQKQILHDDLWNLHFTAVIQCHDWSRYLLHDMGTEKQKLVRTVCMGS